MPGLARTSPPLFRKLAPLLLGATAFTLVVAAFCRELGLSLFANALGVWFAVFVIDRALDQVEADRLRPAHEMLMLEAQRIHNNVALVLGELLRVTATQSDVPVLRDATAGDYGPALAQVLQRANLRGASFQLKPPGIEDGPDSQAFLPWGTVLELEFGDRLRDRVNSFITRYVTVAEPDLLVSVQQLESAGLVIFASVDGLIPGAELIPAMTWSDLLDRIRQLQDAYDRSLKLYEFGADHQYRLSALGEHVLARFEEYLPAEVVIR